jgi:beta-lactamase superfamily II metal-dependent hydrolase
MVARPGQPIQMGSLAITVLGPTARQLEELRKEWVAWLKKSKAQLAKLRNQHKRDVDDLRSGLAPLEVARLSQEMALAIEKDVTPPNLASLVLLVEENGKRLLLTGDAGDESLLEYFEAAGLTGADGKLEVDVLKVPHHGAHNSFSAAFADRIRARHYIFCGDGEHHNPEPAVVKGYLRSVKATPLSTGGQTKFWFNWSAVRATKHRALWDEVEAMFKPGSIPAGVRLRTLGKSDTRLTLDLA